MRHEVELISLKTSELKKLHKSKHFSMLQEEERASLSQESIFSYGAFI